MEGVLLIYEIKFKRSFYIEKDEIAVICSLDTLSLLTDIFLGKIYIYSIVNNPHLYHLVRQDSRDSKTWRNG